MTSSTQDSATQIQLPEGMKIFERGWLSSNNILFEDSERTVLIDTGYVAHKTQTLALIHSALGERPLDVTVNTHLHSDHCGGNAHLQKHYPHMELLVPEPYAPDLSPWNPDALSMERTGQSCERFVHTGTVRAGDQLQWGGLPWQAHAAPGHDPHSLIFFQAETRCLISADALWSNGFGVVFPELEGEAAFEEVGATLDLLESLDARLVVPGHGPVFGDVHESLQRARARLSYFQQDSGRHARYAGKVLIKFKLMEWQTIGRSELHHWSRDATLLRRTHQRFFPQQGYAQWIDRILEELKEGGALQEDKNGQLSNGT